MHKEAAVWESKPEANGQDQRVCQQNVPKTYLDLTHHLGGNQTIHGGMPYPYYHVITLAPGCPSLERAGEERRSWKDLAFIPKKIHHRRAHLKEHRL